MFDFFYSSITLSLSPVIEPSHLAPKVQFPAAHACVDEGCQCCPEILLSYQSVAKHFSVDELVVRRITEDITDIIIQTVHPQLICFSIMLLELCTPFLFLLDVLCKTPASISLEKASPALVLTALGACWGGLVATKVPSARVSELSILHKQSRNNNVFLSKEISACRI